MALFSLLIFSLSCNDLKKQHEVTSIEFLSAPGAEKLALPFSEAVRVGDMLYLSGQVGTVPGTTELVPERNSRTERFYTQLCFQMHCVPCRHQRMANNERGVSHLFSKGASGKKCYGCKWFSSKCQG
jgi:hypothetical protein